MRMRTLLFTLAATLLLAGCDIEEAFGNSERYTEDFHHTYPLKPGGKIFLENFNGSIEVSGWDQDSVEINGTKYASTPELRDAIKIDIVTSGDSIQIRTIRPSERRGNMGAKYVVKVPRRTELQRITSSNGSIRANGIEGFARLRTSNGAVRTANLRGDLEAQTSNGAVEVEKLDGNAVLKTSNGSVRAEGVRGSFEASTSNGGIRVHLLSSEPGRPVKLETSNGGVELTLDAPNQNDIRASTSNGGITLHLPPSVGARVKASTSNSSISSEFDIRKEGTNSKTRLEGIIGAGGPTLELGTSNGSIRLLKL